MTTTPIDDAPGPHPTTVDRPADRDGAAVGTLERPPGMRRAAARRLAAADRPTPVAWRHPVGWFEARTGWRFLPGVTFPLAVWAVWRAVQLAVSVHLGGDAVKTAYNYDGERYLQILHYGYANYRVEMPNTAFFPGLSWLAWPFYQATHSNALTVHLVATLTGVATFVTIWGVSRAWKDDRIARGAVLLLALSPSSLYLWQFYSEGLFIALGAGGVWADRKGKHWIATLCFAGIATTRTVGILVPAVIVLARIIRQRRVDRWAVAYAVAPLVALGPVLWMMKSYTGDPIAFMKVQNDWGRGLSAPWTTLKQGWDNLWPTPETIMVPARVARNWDLWSAAVVLLAIGYAAFSRKDRWPMETWMVGVALILLPLMSTSLASFNRFALACWIIYPVWASFLGRLPTWWRRGAWLTIVVALSVTSWYMVGRLSVDRFVG